MLIRYDYAAGCTMVEEVYITDAPDGLVLEKDGRLSLRSLKLDPDTISIQGKRGLVASDGVTKRSWTEVLQTLGELGVDTQKLGTMENPLRLTGDALSGWSGNFVTICALSMQCPSLRFPFLPPQHEVKFHWRCTEVSCTCTVCHPVCHGCVTTEPANFFHLQHLRCIVGAGLPILVSLCGFS